MDRSTHVRARNASEQCARACVRVTHRHTRVSAVAGRATVMQPHITIVMQSTNSHSWSRPASLPLDTCTCAHGHDRDTRRTRVRVHACGVRRDRSHTAPRLGSFYSFLSFSREFRGLHSRRASPRFRFLLKNILWEARRGVIRRNAMLLVLVNRPSEL